MNSEWQWCSLSELIDIMHGFAFKGGYFTDEPGGDILLTPGNFAVGGGFKDDKFKYYNGPVPEDYVLAPGDLIVTMTDLSKAGDTLGYSAIVPEPPTGYRFLHNQRLGKVEILPGAPIDIGFLNYLLRTRQYRHEVLASATGTSVRHTSPTRIRAFEFLLPPLEEQRAIAHILGTLDDKIELNRHMNVTLEAMARVIFKAWFVDFDPVHAKARGEQPAGMDAATAALFPDSFEESELGPIPRGWKVGILGDEFNITMGQSPPGSTYNEEGEGLPFYQGRRDFGFRYPSLRVYCTEPNRLAEKDDTLISVRAPVGDINMALERCCIGRGVAAARYKSGSRSYTYYAMHSLSARFDKYEGEGTVFGSISGKNFRTMDFFAPPTEIVDRFEDLTNSIDQLIETNEKHTLTLSDLRDTLLPKLISGQLRIGEIGNAIAT